MSKQTVDFLNLFKQKKYSLIISIIEKQTTENQRTPGLLNLRGVCRMMLSDTNDTINLAINDFKESYYKETNKSKSLDQIKNLINASVIFFDNEFTKNNNILKSNFFDEINSIYEENKQLFENSLDLNKNIFKVFKRTLSVREVIKQLKKTSLLVSDSDTIASHIYLNNYLYDWSQSDYLKNSKILSRKLSKYPSKKLLNLVSKKNDKIKLGFISSDIRSKHSVTYFLRTLISNYDKNKYEIYLYHNHNVEDDTTKEFEKYVSKTLKISKLNNIEAINTIRKDEIDIIIDLNGLSSNHRLNLFKNRLARTQILWCGYTNTSGLDEMDYLIVDKNLIKKNEESFYSEKIIYLPNVWNCHSGYNIKRLENELPLKKNGHVTFGSFNNFKKINDEVVEVWSSILKKVKNSRLLLKTSVATSQELYEKKFKKYGVLDSITFLKYSKNFMEHLNEYKKIDIALDTFPWNGVTTSFEAIWMNVPVVVMSGFNFNSRCGSSINLNLGFQNLIGDNKEDYVKKAVLLAKDEKSLQELRRKLYENALKTPLFDQKKFSNDFFSSLQKIYN
tara:strand:+ start:108 stop:1790 length:1683 start_codon:yes stop_codon:yes gene_type:complete